MALYTFTDPAFPGARFRPFSDGVYHLDLKDHNDWKTMNERMCPKLRDTGERASTAPIATNCGLPGVPYTEGGPYPDIICQ